jgi:transposase InsO family protein
MEAILHIVAEYSRRFYVEYHLYVVLDIFSRYVVGWMVALREAAELAD